MTEPLQPALVPRVDPPEAPRREPQPECDCARRRRRQAPRTIIRDGVTLHSTRFP